MRDINWKNSIELEKILLTNLIGKNYFRKINMTNSIRKINWKN